MCPTLDPADEAILTTIADCWEVRDGDTQAVIARRLASVLSAILGDQQPPLAQIELVREFLSWLAAYCYQVAAGCGSSGDSVGAAHVGRQWRRAALGLAECGAAMSPREVCDVADRGVSLVVLAAIAQEQLRRHRSIPEALRCLGDEPLDAIDALRACGGQPAKVASLVSVLGDSATADDIAKLVEAI